MKTKNRKMTKEILKTKSFFGKSNNIDKTLTKLSGERESSRKRGRETEGDREITDIGREDG